MSPTLPIQQEQRYIPLDPATEHRMTVLHDRHYFMTVIRVPRELRDQTRTEDRLP
ncbi:MAG: hypothetical protein LBG99_09220 [Propionibacteriaceae bacterium]|nr:hypothetical protein [Propionibacteriaceae bacterium]